MSRWMVVGALALVCGVSVYWTEPWIQAPRAPIRSILTEAQIRNEVQYQANLHAARAVLRGCGAKIPEFAAQAAIKNRIPVRIVAADIVVESGCNPRAVSRAGAVGLMQVMGSIHRVSRKRLLNPEENVNIGTRILAQNIHRYGYHNGLARYFGITAGSDASAAYAIKVLSVAYRENQ